MTCRYCGRKIPDDASFCPSCGKRTEAHLRAEDRYEDIEDDLSRGMDVEGDDPEIDEPKRKRRKGRRKALISIIAAILFVVAAFIIVMIVAKHYLGEEPWNETAPAEEESDLIADEPVTMYVSAEDGALLLSAPGEDSDAVHILINGQEVQADSTEDGWYHVTADGVTGWVSAEYLSEDSVDITVKDTAELSDEDKGKLVEPSVRISSGWRWTVNTDGGLNLRCGPGQEYDIILVVPDKTEVVEAGRDGSWLYVKYEGQYGWISLEYITPADAQ